MRKGFWRSRCTVVWESNIVLRLFLSAKAQHCYEIHYGNLKIAGLNLMWLRRVKGSGGLNFISLN
jgi:hypothetical protein